MTNESIEEVYEVNIESHHVNYNKAIHKKREVKNFCKAQTDSALFKSNGKLGQRWAITYKNKVVY